MVDWSKPESMVSKHFSVHEALYLPSWARMSTEKDGLSDAIKAEIVRLAGKVDIVCDRLGIRATVHCWYRPRAYNKAVGGAANSGHICDGPWSAVDFSAAASDAQSRGEGCEILRKRILAAGLLDELDLRMENNGPDAPWIHLDTKPIVFQRYFRP
jgi:hypothetical protein